MNMAMTASGSNNDGSRQVHRGPINRTSGMDIFSAREIFQVALVAVEPAERSQRQSVAALMPELYTLRNKGFSWPQLSELLKECNIRLLPSTVRTYYAEMLESRMDECQRRFNEHMVVLAEVRKATRSGETASLVERTSAILEQQKRRSAVVTGERIDALFGGGQVIEHGGAAEPSRKKMAPASPGETPASAGEFGLAVAATAPVIAKGGGVMAFLDDSEPNIPELANPPSPTSVAVPKNGAGASGATLKTKSSAQSADTNAAPPSAAREGNLRCMPLPAGMKVLPKRPGVDDSIYDSDGLMPHPAIDGLLLSRAERVFGAYLEYADAEGVVQIETLTQKTLRIKWQPVVRPTISSTEGNFVNMDASLFPGKSGQ